MSRNESLISYCPRLIEENVKSELCDSCISTVWSVEEKETRDFMEQGPSVYYFTTDEMWRNL